MTTVRCPSCESSGCRSVGPIPDSIRFAGALLAHSLPGGTLFECAQCCLWFRHPRLPKEAIDRLYTQASAEIWVGDSSRRMDWALVRAVLHESMPRGRVLDIGCFDGGLLHHLGPGYKLFGVELNREARKVAASRGVTLLAQDYEQLAQCEMRFDAVVATDVVEHTYDPNRFLRDCVKLLAPGGIVLMSTGTTDAWSWRLMGGHYWYCANAEHLSFLNEAWVRKACARHSLDTVRVHRFAHDSGFVLSLTQSLLNLGYRAWPLAVGTMKRVLARDPRTRERPELRMAPPSWSTAKDHMLFALKART